MNDEILELFTSNTQEFEETTPENNKIKGKILLNHGEFHGSLLITQVNDMEVQQFIRGFPKIKYYDPSIPLSEQPMIAYEKLDGTCIGFYKLRDGKGEVIEIVPKSRQKAVLDKHFQGMLKHCPTMTIYNKSWEPVNPDIIFFELFGMLNEHTIPHKQTYIDLRLIGAGRDEYMLPTSALQFLSRHLFIPMPNKIFTITPVRKVSIDWYSIEGYYLEDHANQFDTEPNSKFFDYTQPFEQIITDIKLQLDTRNLTYKRYYNSIYYEGVVIQNCHDGYNHYIKVKPDSFYEAEGKTRLGVAINEIRKEIVKIINENITEYNENYNENDVIQYIKEMLLEEYDKDTVEHPQTKKVITKELRKYIESISDTNTNRIVDELLQEVPHTNNITDYMRYYAKKYPMLKHKSQDVYFVLEKRLKKITNKGECD